MSIAGNLRTLDLSELLQWLSHGRKTGTLVIESGATEKRIYFSQGRIVGSSSSEPDEHLGNFLIREELIDDAMLTRAFKLQKATNILLGKVLSTLGVVPSGDLDRVLRSKSEESIYELFGWQEGEFRFLRDDLPDWPMVPISLDVTNVVLEGLHRLDLRRKLNGGSRPEAVEDRVPESPPTSSVEEVPATEPEPLEPEPLEPEQFQTVRLSAPPEEGASAPEIASEPAAESHPVESPELSGYYQTLPATKSRKLPLIAIGAILLATAGLVAGYFLYWQPSPPDVDQAAALEATPILRIPRGPDDPLTGDDWEVAQPIQFPDEPPPIPGEATLSSAPDAESDAEREARLRDQYEEEIAALRRQLEEAQQESEPSEVFSPPLTGVESAEPGALAEQAPGRGDRRAESPAGVGEERAVQEGAEAGGPAATPEVTSRQQPIVAEPGSTPSGSASGQDAAPEEPEVREGDLVTLGPGVMPPQILQLPRPRYPPAARRLRQQARVAVKVLVDETGKATDARLVGNPVGMGFDESALAAARETEWQPATKDGIRVKMWMDLRIEFRP